MTKYRQQRDARAVPVVYCRRQEKWLPIEEHAKCEYCAGPRSDGQGPFVRTLAAGTQVRAPCRTGSRSSWGNSRPLWLQSCAGLAGVCCR